MKLNIALTCIFKDDTEYDMAKRMLESFMPHVDGLYVALTGTSQKFTRLKALIKRHGGKYIATSPKTHPKIYTEGIGFSNFAEARNVSWSIVDKKYDYLMWSDVDDVLISGSEIRKAGELAKKRGVDNVFFNYWYAVKTNKQGQIVDVEIQHYRERLLAPNKFKWVSRLHEVAVPIEESFKPKVLKWDESPQEGRKCVWCHLTSNPRIEAALERNIRILNIQIEEEQYKDPRTIFYLAKVYFDKGDVQSLDKAIPLLEKYLELSGWDAERSNALEYLGLIYEKKQQYDKAIATYQRAIHEFPVHHLPYLRLSSAYFNIGHNEFASHWLNAALKMDNPKSSETITNTKEIKLLATSLKYLEARRKADIEGMVEWASKRATLMGKDDGAYSSALELQALNTAATGIFNLCKWLDNNNHKEAIKPIIESLPRELGQLPTIGFISTKAGIKKKWSDKSIVYYASFGSPHFEIWGPESIDKGGIGGSETAVIRLSEEWAKMGYEVTVYADVDKEKTVNDVHYLPYYSINWNDHFNVLILWRSPHLIQRVKKANKLFMDLHDIASQADWDEDRMKAIDKVFFKSKWHRTNLPKLKDSKAVSISNGIQI